LGVVELVVGWLVWDTAYTRHMGEAPEPPISRLTQTERQILELLVQGADTGTIASQLGITRGAVGTHVARILSKVGVHSRLEAATKAVSAGFLGFALRRPIRALIVDDHDLFAEAIKAALSDARIDAAAVLGTGREAIEYALEHRPDVVILDLGLPDMSGLAAGRKILQGWPDAKLIALTALDDPRAIHEATAIGFRGYLTKDTPVSRFVGSIEAVVSGELVFPPISSKPDEHQPDPLDELTKLEWRTIGLLANGADEATIASTLGLPREEVGLYVAGLLDKLGVPERIEDALRRIGSDPMTTGSEHPHPSPLDDVQLLAHLRFMHGRGIPRFREASPEELRRFHDLMHREPPPSPA
jgi:two-component system, NarL family, response regulator LiaR